MPKATISKSTEVFDLKSCAGGKITLRRMTYGQKLERVEMATKQVIKAEQDGRNRRNASAEMDIRMMQRIVTEYEFKHCIVDHNLEDDNEQKLNFQNPQTLDVLDPQIGDEISGLIEDMNNFNEDQPGNSVTGS